MFPFNPEFGLNDYLGSVKCLDFYIIIIIIIIVLFIYLFIYNYGNVRALT